MVLVGIYGGCGRVEVAKGLVVYTIYAPDVATVSDARQMC